MANFNNTFSGNIRLADDAKVNTTKNGKPVCNIAGYNITSDDQRLMVKGVLWNFSEKQVSYFRKGTLLYISGSVTEVQAYLNKQGQPGATLVVTIDRVTFIPTGKGGNSESNGGGNKYATAAVGSTTEYDDEF